MSHQATNSQSSEDDELFLLSMSKIGRLSPWFISILLLANLPGLCIGFLSLIFMKNTENFRVLCSIPELQNVSWSTAQIHNITSENLNTCKYRNYNYSLLSSGMSFDAVLDYVQSLKNKPRFVSCKNYSVFKNTQPTIFSEFNLGCNNWSTFLADLLGNSMADILAGAFIIPLGDILGRKRLLSWGVNFMFSGDVFVIFAVSHFMLGMGWFLVSLGYRLMKVSTELIVLEIANHNLKRTLYLLTHLGTPLGYILAGAFYNLPCHWRHLSMLASIPVLFLPILEWYFPESPRWLLSKKRKTKAFAILENIKEPEMQEQLLQRYKNFDISYLGTLKDHSKQIKPVFCTTRFLCLCALFVAVGMVGLESFQWKIMEKFKSYKTLFSYTKFSLEIMAVLFGIIPLFVLTKKINTIITAFLLITALIYIVCYSFPFSETANFATVFLLGNTLGFFSFICACLYVLERSPTSHRATVAGSVTVTGVGISKLMLIFCIKYLKVEHLCLVLAVLSVTEGCFPLLFTDDLKEDFY